MNTMDELPVTTREGIKAFLKYYGVVTRDTMCDFFRITPKEWNEIYLPLWREKHHTNKDYMV